ncbi:formate dehydrogenase-N subunit alpha [Nonomuraea typhae]|uniref:Formate dehydrogenase-N subunit alpha n=1 Tax=Nonomuraea typhae TaxID=2603600 RepID=A0ABW7ZBA8_9ACTN
MVSLAATFGRGAMTNHWRDIRHADLILVNGANPAEAHPVGFKWLMRAKLDRGAKIIHADPRFTRTSAVADTYLRIRTGTDVAYFGGLINYVLENRLYHEDYVRWATNAGFVVKEGYAFRDGLFNGFNAETGLYDTASWAYETDGDGQARIDPGHPRSVLNLLREHYRRYTPDLVARVTGIPREQFLRVAELVGETGRPDKVMTIVYAVGLTHHTTGVQLIRSGAILQLLLGNMGRPGGGMNAERGHANIQGNTDHAISWDILPGYLRIPAPGQKDLAAYLAASAAKKIHPRSVNYFGENYGRFLVSLLKSWYGEAATKDNQFAFHHLPKPAANASWISIFDQALRGKMQGVMLSGMTATSIGPDSNQVLKALSNLKWLLVMDPFTTTSSEFWRAPGMDPAATRTEVFMLPATHWIEKDGSFTNSGRWVQWKDQVIPPEGEARHDHWILAELFLRVRDLYETQGGIYRDPILQLSLPYKNPRKPELDEIAQEINGRDLRTGKRLATFADLKDDGSTSAGDWIYTGHYPETGNLAKRRDGVQDPGRNDPTGMGFYPGWAWSWPLNRRVLYNRASADEAGRPWDPSRPGISWEDGAWTGDVPDYPKDAAPGEDAPLPFIMTGEGVGRLFSNSVADGPFPEHYEPIESPVANPLHPGQSTTPVAFLYDKAAGRENRFGTVADYPYVATSYRLTEHEHYVTQNVEHLVRLQPEAFVEVPAGLAGEKGIVTGDMVRVSSKRGRLEVRAVVTGRLGALDIDGRKVYQIGIPIHWGFVGINTGQHWLANALTPFVGDASSRTPEYKAFLVNIEKI